MKRLKLLLGGTFATFYFVFPMGIVFLLLIFTPLMFLSDVNTIRTSGFAGPDRSLSLISLSGLIIGISLLVPALRKVYDIFPWLFSFIKISYVSFIILSLALTILNYGYEVSDSTRHTLFYILMIVFVIIGRLTMSFYFWKKPVNIGEKEEHFYVE